MKRKKYTCMHCKYVKYEQPGVIRLNLFGSLEGKSISDLWCEDCIVDYGKRPIKIKGKKHPVLTIIRRGVESMN